MILSLLYNNHIIPHVVRSFNVTESHCNFMSARTLRESKKVFKSRGADEMTWEITMMKEFRLWAKQFSRYLRKREIDYYSATLMSMCVISSAWVVCGILQFWFSWA